MKVCWRNGSVGAVSRLKDKKLYKLQYEITSGISIRIFAEHNLSYERRFVCITFMIRFFTIYLHFINFGKANLLKLFRLQKFFRKFEQTSENRDNIQIVIVNNKPEVIKCNVGTRAFPKVIVYPL